MQILVKIIGILIVILGVVICSKPNVVQKLFSFFSQGKNLYYAGAFRIAAGVILILDTPWSAFPAAALVLGVLFILSGVIIFTSDLQKLKDFIGHYASLQPLSLRLLGLIAVFFGFLTLIVS